MATLTSRDRYMKPLSAFASLRETLPRFALSLLCILLLSACYFGHSYEICNTDSDCHETRECIDGLCLTRAEYQRCDPTSIRPSGVTQRERVHWCDTVPARRKPMMS